MRSYSIVLLSVLAITSSVKADVFNLTASLAGGAGISGTLDIDTQTGNVTSSNLIATIPLSVNLDSNLLTINNIGNTGLAAIQVSSSDGTAVALLGEPTTAASFVNYAGGSISSGSGLFYNSVRHPIVSGSFDLFATTQVLGDPADIFNVNASLLNGETLSGQVTFDETTGMALGANLTANIVVPFTLSSNILTIINIGNTGLTGIQVSSADGSTAAIFGEPTPSFIGYQGGSISSGSGVFYNGNRFPLISGELTLAPEPASLSLLLTATLPLLLKRRHKN